MLGRRHELRDYQDVVQSRFPLEDVMRMHPSLTCTLVAVATWMSSSPGFAEAIVEAPPAGTFELRADLHGVHPRLHFTAAEVAAIRAKGKGEGKFFVDRMKAAFGGYVGGNVNVDAAWKDYLYGLWGQLSMALLWIVEEDSVYADTAKSWALHYARQSGWPAQTDDLIVQEAVTGMAMTYDILYDELTETEREDIRAKLKSILDAQYDRFFEGSYWTNDFQNNHMHNRISGLGHASIAILGDDPAIDVQKHADLAYHAQQRVRDWAPPDGSTHEGPGYWGYGYHWVTRIQQLFEHTTGVVPPVEAHDRNYAYYPVYMLAPGMLNNYGVADTGGYGAMANLEAVLPAISKLQDERLHGFLKDQMDRSSDAFYQQVGWGLIWYEPSVGVQDYESLPRSRVWEDLDAISVRTGWKENDLGVLFICGPPGGHHMQQKKVDGETDYINVAHDHPDQNHFMIWAHGKMLTDDDGYPKSPDTKLTASHNTVLIDGEGGPEEGTGWYQPFPYDQTAFMQDVAISDTTAYAGGNASRLYTHGERFIRHFLLVEGSYVLIIDDLKGEGAASHSFDWRLHKDGDWTEVSDTEFSVADGDAGLHVRFLAPAAGDSSSSLFGASGTAKPGLSVQTTASETQYLAVLTPQLGGQPSVSAERLDAAGGWAIQCAVAGKTDVFAAAAGAEPVSAGDVQGEAAAVFVRRDAGAVELALVARGQSIEVGGETLLRSDAAANMAWRPTAAGGQLEIEPPYKSSPVQPSVQVGRLVAESDYCVTIDGYGAGKTTTDGDGVAAVEVDVANRRMIVLELAGSGTTCPVETPPDAGAPDGSSVGGSGGSAGGGGERRRRPSRERRRKWDEPERVGRRRRRWVWLSRGGGANRRMVACARCARPRRGTQTTLHPRMKTGPAGWW